MKKLKVILRKFIIRFFNRKDRGEIHYINGYDILPAPLKKMRREKSSNELRRETNRHANR